MIDLFLGLAPIERESQAAVGARWKQSEVSSWKEDRRRQPGCDACWPLEPEGERRHGEPGVLAQQRHQPRDVRLLPEGDITGKQRL